MVQKTAQLDVKMVYTFLSGLKMHTIPETVAIADTSKVSTIENPEEISQG